MVTECTWHRAWVSGPAVTLELEPLLDQGGRADSFMILVQYSEPRPLPGLQFGSGSGGWGLMNCTLGSVGSLQEADCISRRFIAESVMKGERRQVYVVVQLPRLGPLGSHYHLCS